MSLPKILIVDDELNLRKLLSVVLMKENYHVFLAEDGEQALSIINQQPLDLVLMDIRMPKINGLLALKQIKVINEQLPVILMTAYAGVETAVEALKLGAFDYIIKPFDLNDVRTLIRKTLELSTLRRAEPTLVNPIELPNDNTNEKIITNSPIMMALCRNIAKISQTNATVLITGESGTGKELVAKAIHHHSERFTGSFIKVNCGALPENLLESALFGHEKGAFTGAQNRQMGLFERANHGTLLLDEVGEMSANLQVKLLRVLQEREFEPIGSTKTIKTDFRLIAATNRDLQNMVENNQFRQDLFYRLNVMELVIPPLRERPDDIILLARHFAKKFCRENKKDSLDFSLDAVELLNQYAWPGNIRELSNAIERAVILSSGVLIHTEDLPEHITHGKRDHIPHSTHFSNILSEKLTLKEQMKHYERELILGALKQNNGHREQTAKTLGVSKRTLLYKLQEHQID